ncbi:MAG: hypothetical protein A4E72_01468 [Syntrophus sp. PtaU1.Bin208]|nr:MAG: hypothetical protein A4E72_01468 [Syntrophus sp. PtaU1.Bin208]
MNKRQRKKQEKKQMLLAFNDVIGECLASEDPMVTLKEIKTQGEKHFEELGFDVPPVVFNEIMAGCEQIIKEIIHQ